MSDLSEHLVRTAVESSMTAPTANGWACAARDVVAVLRELAETPIAVNEWAAARMRALADDIETTDWEKR